MEKPVEIMGHVPEADETPFSSEKTGNHAQRASIEELKTPATYVGELEDNEFSEEAVVDPFVPFDDLPDERKWVVTSRAVFLGCCCGALVGASNIYLGLKSGWVFSANLLGAIVGFAVLKPLSKYLPHAFPVLGGSFGPRENNIVQTAATAAGGLNSVFISGIPALYQLNLLSTPKEDFWRLVSLAIVGGYFGFSMATPLRKFFIIYVARELKLIFPTPSATSMTIRGMHLAATGEKVAKLKMIALSAAFSGALIVRVVSQYAIGILWDWHFFTWIYIWSGYKNHALAAENWGWYLEWTPAFIGSGMLVGLNPSISFFMGSVIAWGIIGPALVGNGAAFGAPLFDDPTDPSYERWHPLVSYYSLSTKFSTADHPSPRFWLLWPGILVMIVVSFVELALQYKVFVYVTKAIVKGTSAGLNDLLAKRGKRSAFLARQADKNTTQQLVEDSADEKELVSWWMWTPILALSVVGFCLVLGVQFGMPVGESILCLVLAFFFCFLAIQCAGVTDITPLTAASKASQIVLGGASKGENWPVNKARRLNLLGGSLASMGADQASSLVGDFRVGFLLRTSPRQQFLAQGLGTIVAVFLSPALFVLFAKAYPCIIDISAETCAFSAPSVSAWRAVAVAMTDKNFPVPLSSGIFAIIFSVFGGAMVLVRHYAYTGSWEKFRPYHPNMMCIGLAFVIPQTVYGTAMVIGSVITALWSWKRPESFSIYGYAVAAGFIAGEGIGGVINAIFQIAGIAGPDPYGTQIACPGESC